MMNTFIAQLSNYGALGLMVAYIIYDRWVLLRALRDAIDRNTSVLSHLVAEMNLRRRSRR